jgi:hypothetical protein
MLRTLVPVLLLCGCTHDFDAVSYLAFQRRHDDGSYELGSRPLGTMQDLEAVSGSLGTVHQGGLVTMEADGDTYYDGGRALRVGYDISGDLAVPLDEHGLLLWSFYGHLEDLSVELPAHGLDPEVFFPIDTAWTPVLPDAMLEMLPLENAAYATAGHFFILLQDLISKDIPLAANAGIVRHEFGHAVFHWLTTGDTLASSPFDAVAQTEGSLFYSSLHEGYADSFAALTLDDADFFAGSLNMPDRDLSGEHTVATVQLPGEFLATADEELLAIWDPYPLGTLFAASAWDLRVATDDPDEALDSLTTAVLRWTDKGDLGDAWGLLDTWVEVTPPGVAQDALCDAIALRFAGAHSVATCGGRR